MRKPLDLLKFDYLFQQCVVDYFYSDCILRHLDTEGNHLYWWWFRNWPFISYNIKKVLIELIEQPPKNAIED